MPKTRILIVDQYPIMREALKAILKSEDDFEIVGDTFLPEEVSSLAQELEPDIMIVGFLGLNVFGMSVVKNMATCDAKTRLIVLITPGENSSVIMQQALQCPKIKGFLRADVIPDEIKNTIRSVYKGDTYVDPKLIEKVFGRTAEPQEKLVSLRQLQILQMISEGLTNKRISAELGISMDTVKTHIKIILKKLNAADRAQAVAISYQMGILDNRSAVDVI